MKQQYALEVMACGRHATLFVPTAQFLSNSFNCVLITVNVQINTDF